MKAETNRYLGIVVLLSLGFVLGACSTPAFNRFHLVPEHFPRKSADYPISVYSDTEPECPYQEIALITSSGVAMNDTMKGIQQEARKMGGDAVIIMSTPITGVYEVYGLYGVFPTKEWFKDPVAKVVRWIREDCKE